MTYVGHEVLNYSGSFTFEAVVSVHLLPEFCLTVVEPSVHNSFRVMLK